MKKSKFDLLFEEIMKETITVNTFDFQFEEDTVKNEIKCKFKILDKNNKLITVESIINAKEDIIFNLNNTELSEKQFMMKYYKDYKLFKDALSDFKDKSNNAQADVDIDSKQIEPFYKKINKSLNRW